MADMEGIKGERREVMWIELRMHRGKNVLIITRKKPRL